MGTWALGLVIVCGSIYPLPLCTKADNEEAVRKASQLIDIHLADLATQMSLLNRSQMNQRKVNCDPGFG